MKVLAIYVRRTGDLVALARPTGPPLANLREPHPTHEARPGRGQAAAELEVPPEHAGRDLLEVAALYRVSVGRSPTLVRRRRAEARTRPSPPRRSRGPRGPASRRA